jgi:hypothetical protein
VWGIDAGELFTLRATLFLVLTVQEVCKLPDGVVSARAARGLCAGGVAHHLTGDTFMPHRPRTAAPSNGGPVAALLRRTAPLDDLETTLRLLCTGPKPLAVNGRTLGHGLPRRMIPLHELASVLMHPATGHDAREAAWRLLVTRVRTGQDNAVIGACGVALPGLRKAAGRLARATSRNDMQADLLEGFIKELPMVDTTRPGICGRLCNAAHCAARAALRKQEAAASGEANFAPGSTLPPAPFGHPDFVLARAVRAGVLTVAEADLLGATFLEHVPLAQYADRVGITRWAAYRRRDQAKLKLKAGIESGRLCDPDVEVIAEATATLVLDIHPARHR